jgi:outer membrane protein OmpA-like peptidoglycan-associated protein
MSGDGQELYFASKRTEGYGGSDIYVSRRDSKGKWGPAQNLGPKINTDKDDGSPSMHPDHQTLYFRSDGRPGMGSFDIYYTTRNFEDRQWQEPINIGYPINTKHDDGALTVNLAGNEAYFTSDRAYKSDDPNRNLDIYRFALDKSIAPVSSTYIRLQVIDKETQEPLVANVKLVDTDTKAEIINLQSQVNSKILFSMPVGGDYALVTSKEGYVYHSEHIPLTEVKTANIAYEYVVELEKIPVATTATPKVNKAIVLNKIFFESGEATLLKKSDLEINYLVDLMKEQPTLKIKIIGHTDDVGSEADNLKLSQDRAAAVVTALVNKGIANIRLQSEGLGESSPIADNQSEEGKKQNRRTEFLIL